MAEIRLSRQIHAICRRMVKGDTKEAAQLYRSVTGRGTHPLALLTQVIISPLMTAFKAVQNGRLEVEAQVLRDATSLPIWPRAEATPGIGALGLACLIGETGDLRKYSSHSKLWKRLGLAVIAGERQRRLRGPAALAHGYSAVRRGVVWNMGFNMLRIQSARSATAKRAAGRPAGPFRLGYDARKAYELAKGLPLGHAHNRAKRYMEKKLVRNIWRAWRECSTGATAQPYP